MDQWLERLGYTLQWISDTARATLDSSRSAVQDAGERLEAVLPDDVLPEGEAPQEVIRAAAIALAGALGTRLLARWTEPGEVAWGRAVFAGLVGTLLYDLAMVADQRLLQRNFDTIGPLGEALTDDPELQRWAGWGAHYAGGVGLALLYARFLHHRLPGPPVLRGALFGALDATTLAWGGVYPLLHRAGAQFPLPAAAATLAHAPEITAQSLMRHVAYGVGLGMTYRAAGE